MDYLNELVEKALTRDLRSSSLTQLQQQIQTTAKHHAPSRDAILRAVELGDAGVVRAMLGSEKLDNAERKQLATEGLMAWNSNPLASRQPELLFAVLVEQGGDLAAKTGRAPSVAESVGERLGRIEGNERRMKVAGKLKFNTAPCKILTQCWATMAASGANLAQASVVREKAGRLGPVGGQVKVQPAASTVAVARSRLGPAGL